MKAKQRPSNRSSTARPRSSIIDDRATEPSSLPTNASDAARILDAVRDQYDSVWIRYGTNERAHWFALADLGGKPLDRLLNIDPRLIESAALSELKKRIAKLETFRPAIVASSPGWNEDHFMLGDGTVLAPASKARELIIAFEPNPKFERRGSLEDWQEAIGPIVQDQQLALFALSLGLVGPLLPFVPPDYISPFFEFVGKQGVGKSALGVLAMSLWAGDPDRDEGGGETWNLTPGIFDVVKLGHRHVLLLLDEVNQAGSTHDRRGQLIHHAVFSLTNSGSRKRMGDASRKSPAQLAILSTSNRALEDFAKGSPEERAAMHERLITITIGHERPHGVFDTVPRGFKDTAAAAEALTAAVKSHWGSAGPQFVHCLQREFEQDEDKLRESLSRYLKGYRQQLGSCTPRVQKNFALVLLAGRLARKFDVLPRGWGNLKRAIIAVATEAASRETFPAHSNPLKRIQSYVDMHRAKLVSVQNLRRPMSEDDFKASDGFLQSRGNIVYLLVPARTFQMTFPDFESLMRALRELGRARTETGKAAKLTIKTPKAICKTGRVYCIQLSGSPAR